MPFLTSRLWSEQFCFLIDAVTFIGLSDVLTPDSCNIKGRECHCQSRVRGRERRHLTFHCQSRVKGREKSTFREKSSFIPKFVQLPRVKGRECKGRDGRECHFLRRHSLPLTFYVDILFV